MNLRQKFVHGDLVQIAKGLPGSMSHFESGLEALVLASYDDQFGEEDAGAESQYKLMLLPDADDVSWYPESCLTFIEHKGAHFVRQRKEQKQDRVFEEHKQYNLKRGLEPVGTHRRTWKKIGT